MILEIHPATLGNARNLIDDLKELDDLSRRVGDLAILATDLAKDARITGTRAALADFSDALLDVTHDTLDAQRCLYRQEIDDLPESIAEVA